jgi:hypothetical protein
MKEPLKYHPESFKLLALISFWLAEGKDVEVYGGPLPKCWSAFDQSHMSNIELMLKYGCEFRIKPSEQAAQE